MGQLTRQEESDSDKWCIITSQKAEEIPSSLVNIMGKERLEVKYGLAALLSEPLSSFHSRHFVGLPLQFVANLGLPVHVNAVCTVRVKLIFEGMANLMVVNVTGYNNRKQ